MIGKRVFLAFILVFAACGASSASSVLLTDNTGSPLGRLPYLERGEEQLIPVSLLVRKAVWRLDHTPDGDVITAPGTRITIRRGNPFVRVNDGHVQLQSQPEEWDGSLWLPISDLEGLFPTCLERDSATGTLKVQVGTPKPEGESGDGEEQSNLKLNKASWKLGTVIIDPGHGGKDPGARGYSGLLEKTVTLDIAKRAARMLHRHGIDARLTRESDKFIPLKARTEFANSNGGDLFVSIHTNSFHDPIIGGLECYFLSPARTDRAIEAAMKENSVVKLESSGHEYQDLTEDNHILLTMATSQYMKDSELWAETVLNGAKSVTGLDVRGVDQAGFYVLMGASMPAILFECGFITNREDARIMATERGRERLAEAISESVLSMKHTMEASASQTATRADRN